MEKPETQHGTSTPARSVRRTPVSLTGSALVLLLFCGYASAAFAGGMKRVDVSEFLESRGLNPDRVVLPYALTDEMRRWVRDRVPRKLPAEKRLEALAEALLDSGDLDLEYSRSHTGTAEEVFHQRRANCLAFTNLFLGMARELGVPVFFLAVKSEIYRKAGDLVVLSDHIAVGHGNGTDIRMYDFSERESGELRGVRRIPDYTALAMYYSNRGAEELQEGAVAEAVGWFRTAVTIDPELSNGWSNLGVGLRRLGDLEGAEGAYRRAIEVDPRVYSSYHNLAALLRLQGRENEAVEIDALLGASPSRNPYTYLALGDISFRSSRLTEARRFYRRAVHLSRDDAEPYAALGEVAVVTGDLRTARRMLRKAQKLDYGNHRTLRLADRVVAVRD